MDNIEFKASPVSCSVSPISFNTDKCIGCNRCVYVCQCDVLYPSAEKGAHPIVLYPGECYYCGACVMECRMSGAISLAHPLMNRAKFVDCKET